MVAPFFYTKVYASLRAVTQHPNRKKLSKLVETHRLINFSLFRGGGTCTIPIYIKLNQQFQSLYIQHWWVKVSKITIKHPQFIDKVIAGVNLVIKPQVGSAEIIHINLPMSRIVPTTILLQIFIDIKRVYLFPSWDVT